MNPIGPTLLLALLLGGAGPAQADFTLIGRSTLTAMNLSNTGREILFVKKQRMRRDLTDRGRAYTYLYDLGKKEVAVVDHFLRQIEIHTLATTPAGGKSAVKEISLDLAPTGRKHPLQDWNCEEHSLDASMPAELGQEKVKVLLSGQVWLERKTDERKELAPFVKAVEADDFFVGAATPGKTAATSQIQGLNEAMRKVLAKGMLCAAEIQLKYEGAGPMADLARRMATRASIVYESVSDAPLRDETFDIPAGYRVLKR